MGMDSVPASASGYGEEIVLIEDDEPKVMAVPFPSPTKTAPRPDAEHKQRYPVEDEKKMDESQAIADSEDWSTPMERDFDRNPTPLYMSIQKKQWKDTVALARSYPEEARMWVSRKEKDGRMRWRLLPIHAAIVFKAPEEVVEALLAAYPKSAQAKDDQGMLPLHLAFRNGSTEGIVNLLLVAYPQSIEVKDRKGRIPLFLAQASTSPNREAFMRALERGPTYYAVAAAATERAAVTSEQRAIFEAKLLQIRKAHQNDLAQIKIDAETQQQSLELKLAAMERELYKTQETSQVLVDHVNSLEAQLASRSDTERFLATKIATLDSSLRNTHKTREEVEASLKTEMVQLTFDRDNAVAKLQAIESRYEVTKSKLEKSLDVFEVTQKQFQILEQKLTSQVQDLELDLASERANSAILDGQLKKKMENEHGLASQVSALAGKLAESSAEARDNTRSFAAKIRLLEEERRVLRASVQDLTRRLSMVAEVLEQMVEQQQSLILGAKDHEEEMSRNATAHAKIVSEAMRQELEYERGVQEREEIRRLLAVQEKNVTTGEKERENIMTAIALQGKNMDKSRKTRVALMQNVESMGAEISGVLATVMDGIPRNMENKDELVNVVVQAIAGSLPMSDDVSVSSRVSNLKLTIDATHATTTSDHAPAMGITPTTAVAPMTPRSTQAQNQPYSHLQRPPFSWSLAPSLHYPHQHNSRRRRASLYHPHQHRSLRRRHQCFQRKGNHRPHPITGCDGGHNWLRIRRHGGRSSCSRKSGGRIASC
jgi:hypothetical protein